jgi:outer membrane immunogenic protein
LRADVEIGGGLWRRGNRLACAQSEAIKGCKFRVDCCFLGIGPHQGIADYSAYAHAGHNIFRRAFSVWRFRSSFFSEVSMRAITPTAVLLGMLAGTTVAEAGEWTGAYIAIGAGIGAANHQLSLEEAPDVPFDGALAFDGLGGDGGLFTLGVGADYQIDKRFVIGAFFDYDWTDLDTDVLSLNLAEPIAVSANAAISVEDVWSVGGRLGYVVSPSTLLFLTAGYSRADISDLNVSFGGGGLTLARVGEFDGYFIGGGAEVKLTKAISIKGEYRYTDLDAETITLLPGTPLEGINDFVTTKLDPDIQSGRLSLVYKFGAGHGSETEAEPEAAASVGSWSQFYIGLGGAYAFANTQATLTPGPFVDPDDVSGSLSTDGLGSQGAAYIVTLGADRQYDDKFVFGLFVDYTRHNAEYDISLRLEDIFSGRIGYEIEDELSIGGRVGYLLTPATMLFGSVGYSHLWLSDTTASFQIVDGPGGSGVVADNGSFGGVFLGAGFETKLSDRLSLKAEYRYLFADTDTVSLLPGGEVGPGVSIDDFVRTELTPDLQSVRFSLDYRFDFGRSEAAPMK